MTARVDPAVVRALLDYQPDGNLVWRDDRGRARAGAIAGCASNEDIPTHRVRICKVLIPRARLVWAWHYGEWPSCYLLHLNRNRLDDRIENLTDQRIIY